MNSILKILVFFLCSVSLCFSCASSSHRLESHVGLYKVIKANCKLTEGLFNPCDNIRFLEIVKGQFYGVNPDQLALVQWHAEKGSSEVEYTANLISDHQKTVEHENKIWIANKTTNNESEEIFFILRSGIITDYVFKFSQKNIAGRVTSRDFHYKLTSIDRKKIQKYKLNYPAD